VSITEKKEPRCSFATRNAASNKSEPESKKPFQSWKENEKGKGLRVAKEHGDVTKKEVTGGSTVPLGETVVACKRLVGV